MKYFVDYVKMNYKTLLSYAFILIFAFFFFIYLYGINVLDVTNSDWIYGNYEIKEGILTGQDLTQHYIGWCGFRESEWSFPLGCFSDLSYPYSKSIVFTDSIPLLAIIFKMLSPLLPETFQYFGIYGLLSYALMGIISYRIFKRFHINDVKSLLCSLFFIITSCFVWRMFVHTALDSHWILLLAFDLLFSSYSDNKKKLIPKVLLVSFLASTIHMYLYFYCGIILLGYCLYLLLNKRLKESILSLVLYLSSGVFFVWIIGGFSSGVSGFNSVGIDACSMNLNSIFNSYGFSAFLPELKYYSTEGYLNKNMQYEGYSYLGVGVFIALIISAIIVLKNKVYKDKTKVIESLLFVFVLSFIVALSPYVTLGDKLLFHMPIPKFVEDLWAIFRSTGRASWIIVFLLMFVALIIISKYINKYGIVLLSILMALQFIDNGHLYYAIHNCFKNMEPLFNYESQFESLDFWKSVEESSIDNIKLCITTVPGNEEITYLAYGAYEAGPNISDLIRAQYALGDFCVKNDLNYNFYRFSRDYYSEANAFVMDSLEKTDDKTLYVFFDYNKMRSAFLDMNIYYVDGYYICSVNDLNDNYRISPNNIVLSTDFNDDNSLPIDAGGAVLCSCWEVAKGRYILNLDADITSDSIDVAFVSPTDDVNVSVSLISTESTHYSYEIVFDEAYCQACPVIINNSDEAINVSNIKLICEGFKDERE